MWFSEIIISVDFRDLLNLGSRVKLKVHSSSFQKNVPVYSCSYDSSHLKKMRKSRDMCFFSPRARFVIRTRLIPGPDPRGGEGHGTPPPFPRALKLWRFSVYVMHPPPPPEQGFWVGSCLMHGRNEDICHPTYTKHTILLHKIFYSRRVLWWEESYLPKSQKKGTAIPKYFSTSRWT